MVCVSFLLHVVRYMLHAYMLSVDLWCVHSDSQNELPRVYDKGPPTPRQRIYQMHPYTIGFQGRLTISVHNVLDKQGSGEPEVP